MKYWGLTISLATFAVGTVFPAYKSVEALESAGTLDDSQWLTYWLLSSLLTIIERFGYRVLFNVPLYGECKLAILCWLALPMFNGASLIYKQARPYLMDFYSTVRQTTEEIQQEPGDDKMIIDLRTRMTKTRADVAQALLDMYNACYKHQLDPERLKAKLDEVEKVMDISSNTTDAMGTTGATGTTGAMGTTGAGGTGYASNTAGTGYTSGAAGTGYTSGNADLLSGGGGGGGDGLVSNMGSVAQEYNASSGSGMGSGTGMGPTY